MNMMAGVSAILVAVLVMAALLGCLIGIAATVLVGQRRAGRRARASELDVQSRLQAAATHTETALETLTRERDRLADSLAGAREDERVARAGHDALQMHSHIQARRIDSLMEEQQAAEERQMRLQRALRSQQQESDLIARERGLRTGGDVGDRPGAGARSEPGGVVREVPRADESALPVLNRRAESAVRNVTRLPRSRLSSGRLARGLGARSGGAGVAQARAIEEIEFPALSEAELPDDVDGLDLDVVDAAVAAARDV